MNKKKIGIISIIIFIILLVIQLGYQIILKRRDYEYVNDIIPYLINQIILITAIISIMFLTKKNKTKEMITYVLFSILTVINIAFMANNAFENNCIVSFSKNFSNELVIKQNKSTGKTTIFTNAKFLLFAKSKEQFEFESEGKIKYQWLEKDICSVTYQDKDRKVREYVATYGDRGDGISYYYVTTAINGEWQEWTQNSNGAKIVVDSNGIKVTKNGKEEQFGYEDCKQYGTIALVLYKEDMPRYVISLNKDCKIDESSGIITKGGTITLLEVSMEKTREITLNCVIYKDDENLGNYKIVQVGENEYKIKNGILYISYDGKDVIEVPGDFSYITQGFDENTYQISKEKTVFIYQEGNKQYLLYSNDMGRTWEKVKLEEEATVQNIHFVNQNVGYILEFMDVAMGVAFGDIKKTTDGGKTWQVVNSGIGDEEKIFRRGSQIKFINGNVGFLTMPTISGESCELYTTRNGGKNFQKLTLIDSNIYDYYNLPEVEDGQIMLKIGQGSDGDYNGGDEKTFVSKDEGVSFYEVK